jgi:hypothetical protein
MINRLPLLSVISAACLLSLSCGLSGNTPPALLSSYKVEWVDKQVPAEMQAGKDYIISATIKNLGDATWPWTLNGRGRVHISYHWAAQGGNVVVWDGTRSGLPHDIAPGETFTANDIHVTAPKEPGSYQLQLTLVHDPVAWFDQKGAAPLAVPVKVN